MTLKEYVHDNGLTWAEFKRFDKETEMLWRDAHRRANIRIQKEREEAIKENLK